MPENNTPNFEPTAIKTIPQMVSATLDLAKTNPEMSDLIMQMSHKTFRDNVCEIYDAITYKRRDVLKKIAKESNFIKM